MEGRTATRLPEGIATMPPGAALAAVLEEVDLASLPSRELPVAMRALWRQRNHDDARLLDAVRECGLGDRRAPEGRRETLDEFSADETRATLRMSRTGAWKLLGLAEDLVVRLPAVREALHDGRIDEPRALAFRDGTDVLSPAHTDRVVEIVLPEAPRLTAWALRQRIEQVAIALDPDWARKRREEAERQRRVRARRTEAGTANLSGLDLPLDETAGAVAHLEGLVVAAKAAGHPGLLDTIRSDLFLALLSGRFAGYAEDEIVSALVADATAQPTPAPDDPAPGGGTTPQDGPTEDDPDPAPDEPASDDPIPDEPTPDADGGAERPGGPRRRTPRRARIELRIALTTLLGLDDRPGEMAGWGPVDAALARDLAATHVRGEWRIAVTRPDGSLAAALLPPRRPDGWRGGPSHAVVEIGVDAEVLAGLDPESHPGWTAFLVDLQARLSGWAPPSADDPQRRFPREELARWIRMRDRSCVFPVCGTPASAAEIDHTVAVAEGGPTVDVNLGPMCKHDHLTKHEGGWDLEQVRPGVFVWTSRCGARHERPPLPVLHHLPEADPPPEDARSAWHPHEHAGNVGVWTNVAYPVTAPRAGPAPPRPRSADDDPPPF